MSVRGNHECYFDKDLYLDTLQNENQWDVPYYYYSKVFDIGKDGEKIAFLMVDSCLLLCSNQTFKNRS